MVELHTMRLHSLGAILQLDYYGYLNENVIGKSAHIFGNTYLDK